VGQVEETIVEVELGDLAAQKASIPLRRLVGGGLRLFDRDIVSSLASARFG
jgi:hypothetical protein